jgi:hypothetical protein
MELDVTWPRAIRIWWSYLWRNVIAVIVAMLIGAVIGGVLGGVLTVLGASLTTIRIVCFPLGFVIGLVVSVFPLKMILGKDFGEFRLVLLSNASPAIPPMALPPAGASGEPSEEAEIRDRPPKLE